MTTTKSVLFGFFLFFLGIGPTWYFTYDYAISQIKEAKNDGVMEERSRWNEIIQKEEITKRVAADAEKQCGVKIRKLEFENEKYNNLVDSCKQKSNERLIRLYFESIFNGLRKIQKKLSELSNSKIQNKQAIILVNADARNLFRNMKRGRKAFETLAIALNHDAKKILEDLEKDDLSILELRKRIIPLAKSKKEKSILLERALDDISK